MIGHVVTMDMYITALRRLDRSGKPESLALTVQAN